MSLNTKLRCLIHDIVMHKPSSATAGGGGATNSDVRWSNYPRRQRWNIENIHLPSVTAVSDDCHGDGHWRWSWLTSLRTESRERLRTSYVYTSFPVARRTLGCYWSVGQKWGHQAAGSSGTKFAITFNESPFNLQTCTVVEMLVSQNAGCEKCVFKRSTAKTTMLRCRLPEKCTNIIKRLRRRLQAQSWTLAALNYREATTN